MQSPRSLYAIRYRNCALAERCIVCEVRGIRSSVLSDGADCDCVVLRVIRRNERICSNGDLGVNRGFLVAAVVGFKTSAWTVVGALAGHGVLDALHGNVLENSGGPVWWAAFCLAYDLGAAGTWHGSYNAGMDRA